MFLEKALFHLQRVVDNQEARVIVPVEEELLVVDLQTELFYWLFFQEFQKD